MARKNILIVSATVREIEGLIPDTNVNTGNVIPLDHVKHSIDLFITGPGMITTAYNMGRLLGGKKYDLAINAGIAGSFNADFSIGKVVNVTTDCFPELGAETENSFIPLYKMEMSKPYMPSFINGKGIIENLNSPVLQALKEMPSAKAITVNTISGDDRHIEIMKNRTRADIETMEGAAFFFACHMSGVPCLQIRAISNYIEPRNLKNWNIELATSNLNQTLKHILDEL